MVTRYKHTFPTDGAIRGDVFAHKTHSGCNSPVEWDVHTAAVGETDSPLEGRKSCKILTAKKKSFKNIFCLCNFLI